HLAGKPELTRACEASPEALSESEKAALFEYFLGNFSPSAKQASKELSALRREQAQTINAIPELMVMEELSSPKPAHILKRGAYDAPGEEVSADTPRFLPPFPKDAP